MALAEILPSMQRFGIKPSSDPAVATKLGLETRFGPAIADGKESYVGQEVNGKEVYWATDSRGNKTNDTLDKNTYLDLLYGFMTRKGYQPEYYKLKSQHEEGDITEKVYVHPSVFAWTGIVFEGHEYWSDGERMRVDWFARKVNKQDEKLFEVKRKYQYQPPVIPEDALEVRLSLY